MIKVKDKSRNTFSSLEYYTTKYVNLNVFGRGESANILLQYIQSLDIILTWQRKPVQNFFAYFICKTLTTQIFTFYKAKREKQNVRILLLQLQDNPLTFLSTRYSLIKTCCGATMLLVPVVKEGFQIWIWWNVVDCRKVIPDHTYYIC